MSNNIARLSFMVHNSSEDYFNNSFKEIEIPHVAIGFMDFFKLSALKITEVESYMLHILRNKIFPFMYKESENSNKKTSLYLIAFIEGSEASSIIYGKTYTPQKRLVDSVKNRCVFIDKLEILAVPNNQYPEEHYLLIEKLGAHLSFCLKNDFKEANLVVPLIQKDRTTMATTYITRNEVQTLVPYLIIQKINVEHFKYCFEPVIREKSLIFTFSESDVFNLNFTDEVFLPLITQ